MPHIYLHMSIYESWPKTLCIMPSGPIVETPYILRKQPYVLLTRIRSKPALDQPQSPSKEPYPLLRKDPQFIETAIWVVIWAYAVTSRRPSKSQPLELRPLMSRAPGKNGDQYFRVSRAVHMCTYMYTHRQVCMYVCMYVCMHVCIYIYTHVSMHIHVHVHRHIRVNSYLLLLWWVLLLRF